MVELCRIELIYAAILVICSMNVGFIMAYPSVSNDGFKESFSISKNEARIFETMSYITAIAGPYISDFILNFCGRKTAMFGFTVFCTILWFVYPSMNGNTFWIGYVDRAFMGFLLGAYSALIPLYLVELTPPKASGFFGSFYQSGLFFGTVSCQLIGVYLDWKNMSYIGGGICLLFLFMVWFIPDSPAVVSARSAPESIFQKEYMKKLVYGLILFFFQSFTGYCHVMSTIYDVFMKAGIVFPKLMANSIAGTVAVVSAFIGGFVIQWLGRKVSWIISSAGITISHLIQAVSLKTDMPNWIPFFTLLLFLFSFSVSMGSYPYFAMAETMPTPVRSIAVTIAASESWGFYLLHFMLNEVISELIGEFALVITYMGIAVCSCVFGFFFVETPDFNAIGADLYHDMNEMRSSDIDE
ncbi:major facilitator superfamily transporter [Tritrichomonas foetus]|uniref:Major facilitator superfamily transporter n=1 Tax=Tritrichomonas foetus TaxID=1144522 RepID=A0A1J4JFV6_9EUKA|nr:major facilitator superfamily transporter [Tritrichomonas foetus]|eukprot:OHS96349.1 major facilitator superfamily transporter [Tritrichomonas foetus]